MCPNPLVCFPYFARFTPRMLPVYSIFVQLSTNVLCWLAADLSSRCCITTIVSTVACASFHLSATPRCFENHNEVWVLFLHNFRDVFWKSQWKPRHEESGSQLQISILSNYKPFFGQNNAWPKGSSHFRVKCDPVKGILYIWHMTLEIHSWKFADPWKHNLIPWHTLVSPQLCQQSNNWPQGI